MSNIHEHVPGQSQPNLPISSRKVDVEVGHGNRPSTSAAVSSDRIFMKLNWFLLPILFTIIFLAYIDRTNLAYASIMMNQDLGFSNQVYGIGSSAFFTTYASLQIPSNLLLRRFGGPQWLAAMTFMWGVTAAMFSFVKTPMQFYLLRALLGVAEAGTFPGLWYMVSQFFPAGRATVAYAVLDVATALANFVVGPLAATILGLDGWMGYRGWQWLFLIEGIPSITLGILLVFILPTGPDKAYFLTKAERSYLSHIMYATNMVRTKHSQQHDEPRRQHSLNTTARDEQQQPLLSNQHHTYHQEFEAGNAQDHTVLIEANGSGSNSNALIRSDSISSVFSDSADSDASVSLDDKTVTKLLNDAKGLEGNASDVLLMAAGRSASVTNGGITRKLSGSCRRGVEAVLGAESTEALAAAFSNKYVWFIGSIELLKDTALYGILFFMPMIVEAVVGDAAVKGSGGGLKQALPWANSGALPGATGVAASLLQHGASNTADHPSDGRSAAMLSAIPYGLAAASSLLIAHSSQYFGERVLHSGLAYMASGIALILIPVLVPISAAAAFACLCVAVVGSSAVTSPILSLLSELGAGPGLVVAFPLFNSLGNIGGLIGPSVIGFLLDGTSSFTHVYMLMSVCMVAASIMLLSLPRFAGRSLRSPAGGEAAPVLAH